MVFRIVHYKMLYYDSLIRLGFISIRIEDLNLLNNIINELDQSKNNFYKNLSKLNKKNPYKFLRDELSNVTSLYYILKAEHNILKNGFY